MTLAVWAGFYGKLYVQEARVKYEHVDFLGMANVQNAHELYISILAYHKTLPRVRVVLHSSP